MLGFRARWLSCLFAFGLSVSRTCAEPGEAIELRLIPIVQGNRDSSFGEEPERFRQTPVYQAAQKSGVDIADPDDPLVICRFKNRRLFYLFYNLAMNVPGLTDEAGEPYLIQRIKRTVTDFSPGGEPSVKVDHSVEVMKTKGGRMKRTDQHFGSFGIYEFQKRRIVKEFEVGVGEIEGIAKPGAWPFDAKLLFKRIQPYQKESAAYEKCRFTNSKKWTLTVEFDALGNYAMTSPELGIELVHRLPEAFTELETTPRAAAKTEPAEAEKAGLAEKDIVLKQGQGVFDLAVGKSRLEDVTKKLGEPLRVKAPSPNAKNYEFANGLTFNITNGGTINTIFTQPRFHGTTSKGIGHGDSREKVNKAYGHKARAAGLTEAYDGILFWFDPDGRVTKIVVYQGSGQNRKF